MGGWPLDSAHGMLLSSLRWDVFRGPPYSAQPGAILKLTSEESRQWVAAGSRSRE
jgi:hypothetical protein